MSDGGFQNCASDKMLGAGGNPFLERASSTIWDPADALEYAGGHAAFWPICAV